MIFVLKACFSRPYMQVSIHSRLTPGPSEALNRTRSKSPWAHAQRSVGKTPNRIKGITMVTPWRGVDLSPVHLPANSSYTG